MLPKPIIYQNGSFTTRLGPKIQVNSVNSRFEGKIYTVLIWEKIRCEFGREHLIHQRHSAIISSVNRAVLVGISAGIIKEQRIYL